MLTSIDQLTDSIPEELLQRIAAIGPELDTFISEEADGSERPPGIHASELSCERKVVYNLLNTAPYRPIPAKWKKKFQVGHVTHGMIQGWLTRLAHKSGGLMAFEPEVAIDPYNSQIAQKYNIYSHCDGVIILRERDNKGILRDKLRVMIEIKTASPTDFEKTRKPKQQHIDQATVYMACLNIPLTWFIYWNKGNENCTSPSGSFLTAFDPQVWYRLEGLFEQIHQHVAEGTLPERSEGVFCEFCPYRKVCQPTYLMRQSSYGDVRNGLRRR